MKAALRSPVPSSSVLWYLRTQAEDIFAQASSKTSNRCPRQSRFISTRRIQHRRMSTRIKLNLTLQQCTFCTTTAIRNTWKLWGMSAHRRGKPLKAEDLPSDDFEQGSIFNMRRVMTAKAGAEPRLRCTEVDENGEVILMDGEFKKTELIAKVNSRDIKDIEYSIEY